MDKYYKFDSGLTLFYTKNTINKSTAVVLQFDCGARCDGEKYGLSHFCEHCFFTGTENLNKQQVSKRYFDFVNSNASTGFKFVEFCGEVLTYRFGEYLDSVADMICNSTFSKTNIEDEKKVVLQEIVRSADKTSKKATDFKNYVISGMDMFEHTILGNEKTVSEITNQDIKKYVKKYFVNNNCFVYVCSPLSFSKTKKIVKERFERKMPSNPKLKPLPYQDYNIMMNSSLNIKTEDCKKNYFTFALKSSRKGPDLKYSVMLGIISNMITDFAEGLTKRLRIDNGLIYGLSADYILNQNGLCWFVSTEISTENINKCIDVIADEIVRLSKDGFTEMQFKDAIEKNEYYWQTRIDKPVNMLRRMEKYRKYGKFVTDKDVHEMIKSLTLNQVNEFAKELFSSKDVSVIVYGDATKKDVYTLKQIQKKLN